MNIDWIIPCRYAEAHDNLATIVGAGIDTFWVPELPAPVQVLLTVRLLARADESGEENKHVARNIITDPNGEVIGDQQSEFSIEMENAREDWLNGLILPNAIQFMAPIEGTYTVEHLVDGNSKALPLHVVHGQPGPPAG